MRRIIWGDTSLILPVLLLTAVGLLLIYSATASLVSTHHPQNPEYYLLKYLSLSLIALSIGYAIHFYDYRRLGKWMEVLWVVSCMLLLYVLLRGTGAQRWLHIAGFSFQPSDLAKFSLISVLAYHAARNPQTLRQEKGFYFLMARIALTFFLIAPTNLSTGLLTLSVSLIFLYVMGVRLKNLLQLIAVGLAALVLVLLLAPRAKVWQQRLMSFLSQDKLENPHTYQSVLAYNALTSGGLLGKGPGKSIQRHFLPQSYSDFAFALWVEEYGIVGGFFLLLLYLILLTKVLLIAFMREGFAQGLAVGFFLLWATQILIHVGVNLRLLPVTGIPLPFVSLGGTSLFLHYAMIGILLSISRRV
ncbi:MAG: FtsW/RodA/SpoVE family cell cycle protein [Bacteroidia bacterium]